VVHRPAATGISIVRDDDGSLRVVGRAAERAVALSDITTAEAQAYMRERLDRLGVPKALSRAGAKEGDLVRIGAFAFDYTPDDVTG
jgi:GTP-binding protein